MQIPWGRRSEAGLFNCRADQPTAPAPTKALRDHLKAFTKSISAFSLGASPAQLGPINGHLKHLLQELCVAQALKPHPQVTTACLQLGELLKMDIPIALDTL